MRTRSRLLFLGMMLAGVVIGLLIPYSLQRALSPSPRTPDRDSRRGRGQPAAG